MDDATLAEVMWLLDNVASFSLHIAAGLLTFALALVLTRAPRTSLFVFVSALPFVVMIALAAFSGAPVGMCTTDLPRLRVATVNLLEGNPNTAAVLDFVRAVEADVVALQEAGNAWEGRLDPLFPLYPYRAASAGHATQLFSRHPFVGSPAARVVPSMRRAVSADIQIGGTEITIVASHFLKPQTSADRQLRRAQMDEVGAVVTGLGRPAIVMGDFNAGPTSLDFRSLVGGSALRTPVLQIPPVATWPARLAGLGIQIDHVVATEPFRFERVVAGPLTGSNHRPVVADLAFDPQGICGQD